MSKAQSTTGLTNHSGKHFAPRLRPHDFLLGIKSTGIPWAQKKITDLLNSGGIKINSSLAGNIQVHDERFYSRVITQGSLGLGESYMDGWWNCNALDVFFTKIFSADICRQVRPWKQEFCKTMLAYLTNFPRSRAYQVAEEHYDIGNSFYQAMLGNSMTYSCGYWKGVDSLAAAQEAKFDLICRKLNLQKGQKILDIGCGWGSLARYAAENYGVEVEGITISREQAQFARQLCRGFPITIKLTDYHEIHGQFDRIVSVGMFEHVGYKNYSDYMKIAHRCLTEQGLFLLHTIGSLRSGVGTDPWIHKYIFPNSMLPSMAQITRSIEGLFVIEDVHNFGADYDRTLMAWHQNFENNWTIFQAKYGKRFFRMWRYYLLMCAGLFRARRNQVWQIVLSKHGVPGGYRSIR